MGMDADYAYRNFIQPDRVPPPHKRTAYTGTSHYLDCIAKQILAEYWEFLRSNSGESSGWRKKKLERYRVTVEYTEDDKHCGETLLCVDAEKEDANESSDRGAIDKETQLHDLYGHLGVFCGRLCVLLGQNDQGIKMHMGKSLKSLGFGDLSDDLHTDPRMLYSYGFIGDFIRGLKACIELENLPHGSRILTSLANPKDRERVRYSNIAVSDSVPINDTQQEALASLQYNIEGIQGPPGTGKSTTIFHFVNSCVGAHQTALVLCVQNKAVDAIAEKLCENATELPFMVIGHTGRIGETAKEWTLDAQIARRPEVVAMTEKFHRLNKLEQRLSNACQQKSKIFTKERADVRARQLREYLKTLPTNNKVRDKAEQEWKARRDGWAVAWKAYLFRKYWLLYGMHEKVEAARRDVHDDLKLLKLEVKRELIENARAVLCTVQTVAGREFHDADMQPFRDKLVAVVIDEAGTVPETGHGKAPPVKRERAIEAHTYPVHKQGGIKIMKVPSDADTIDWERVCGNFAYLNAEYRGSGDPDCVKLEDIINLPDSVVEANFKGRPLEGVMTMEKRKLEKNRPGLTVFIDDSNGGGTETINRSRSQ